MNKTLRLVLGDQLNAEHSWFREKNDDVYYLIAECLSETSYVKHHIQKLCAFFLSMEHFANALSAAGHQVIYLTLDDTHEHGDFPSLLKDLIKQHGFTQFEYQRPDEFRLQDQLSKLDTAATIELRDSEHFILGFEELPNYLSTGKAARMEAFYRKLRHRFNILMQDGEPVGGRWNFDSDNRSKLKKQDFADIPEPLTFDNEVSHIRERLDRHDVSYFGTYHEKLLWPCSRRQALELLEHFCQKCLPNFGRFQDAMSDQAPHAWSLYHSRLSFAINTKMLHPMTVIRAAIAAYEDNPEAISLAQIEGFVRQILGWREFIRAIYWMNMPRYASLNTLQAKRPLPSYFWTGETKMQCMKQAITQSLDTAYAHHIQRLMITGNFCLLSGIDIDQVDDWYLGIYIDALEWVEMPNTRGMSQFADGGLLASKPYTASGAYINRMSDHCSSCDYNVEEKVGDSACPFNSLYWHFMLRHRDRFGNNPRIGMTYRNWDKMAEEQRAGILDKAEQILENIEHL